MNEYKTCTKCEQTKSVSDFAKRSRNKDGLESQCKDCSNARKRDWNSRNKNLVSEMNRRSYKKNPELFKRHAQKWVNNNRARAYEVRSNYRSRNKKLVAFWSGARRARVQQSRDYLISKKFIRKLYASSCVYCGSRLNIEADHVVPIVKGGAHSEGNLVAACRACNRSKHDDYVMQWKLRARR